MDKTILTDEERKAIDKTIAYRVISDLLFAGYEISVDNGGEEFTIMKSKDINDILGVMFKTGAERVYVSDSRIDGIFHGYVQIEYGRDEFAVIGDCSVNVKPAIKEALALAAYVNSVCE